MHQLYRNNALKALRVAYNICMKLGQIVLEKLVESHKVAVRYMDKDDAEPMREYINKLSKERTFITYQGEQITSEEEQEYVVGVVKKLQDGTMVKILLFVDGKIAGTADVSLGIRTQSHVGGLGLSLDSDVRGKGLGRLLLETTIQEATKELKGLRMIELSVFANNEIAIKLYESCGFKEVGRIPEKISHKGRYVDEIVMYLQI